MMRFCALNICVARRSEIAIAADVHGSTIFTSRSAPYCDLSFPRCLFLYRRAWILRGVLYTCNTLVIVLHIILIFKCITCFPHFHTKWIIIPKRGASRNTYTKVTICECSPSRKRSRLEITVQSPFAYVESRADVRCIPEESANARHRIAMFVDPIYN